MLQGLLDMTSGETSTEWLCPGAAVLHGAALSRQTQLAAAIKHIARAAPFRHLTTPGGRQMSVAMTNCGRLGWVSDRTGYRYDTHDPDSGKPWPGMPEVIRALALEAAATAGFGGFEPDACLINRYEPGARLSLHVDKDEAHYAAPIVSVSLGLPATFQWGGLQRKDPPRKVALLHGDVVVWGGAARMRYHGVLPVKAGHHPFAGAVRLNLTLRKAL